MLMLLVCVTTLTACNTRQKKWHFDRQIVPTDWTRAEAEARLGPPDVVSDVATVREQWWLRLEANPERLLAEEVADDAEVWLYFEKKRFRKPLGTQWTTYGYVWEGDRLAWSGWERGVSRAEVSRLWRRAKKRERRALLPTLLGRDWERWFDYNHTGDVGTTRLAGLRREEVLALLGPPDHDRRNAVSYNIGKDQNNSLDDRLTVVVAPGWGKVERYLAIRFDDDEIVRSVAIEN